MKKIWYLILLIGIALLATIITPEIIHTSGKKINTTQVIVDDVDISVMVNGRIEAKSEDLKAKSLLIIEKVLVNVGENVEKGDSILKIDVAESKKAILTEYSPDYDSIDLVTEYINAPFSGTINQLNVKDDDTINKDDVIASIIQTDTMQAIVNIGEDVISSIKCGQRAIITGSGFKGRSYNGKVDSISASAEFSSNSQSMIPTIITINNPDKHLRAGYSIKANIVVNTIKNAILLPGEVIMQDKSNNEYVYVINNNKAKKQLIETGDYTNQGVLILNGLKVGDEVALNAEDLIGDVINVINIGEKID